MKKLLTLVLAVTASGSGLAAHASPALVYGIRIYSEKENNRQALVSFPTDSPADVTELIDLSGYRFLAAACNNDKYYMLHSDDGITVSSILSLDLNTKRISKVRDLDWKKDIAANIIFSDMTYDPNSSTLYACGFNLEEAEVIEGETHAPFAIITIDPVTGDSEIVGSQDSYVLATLAADEYGLKGIDQYGTMWEVSKYSGQLDFDCIDTEMAPTGLQSMAYDPENGCWYWAAGISDEYDQPQSRLVRIDEADYEYSIADLGAIGDNSELIGLYVDPFPIPADAPSIPEDVTVSPSAMGEAKAVITWKNPSARINGNSLDIFEINIYRNGIPVANLKDCKPGETMEWSDIDMTPAMYTYSVAARNDVAEGKHALATETWVGTDTPGMPVDISASRSDDGKHIEISWKTPSEGSHGGWFDESGLTYTLVRYPDCKTLFENEKRNGYTDSDIIEIHGYYYEVIPITAAGKGTVGKSAPVVAGPSHHVPYEPDFNINDNVLQWSILNNDNDEYTWYADRGWAGTYDTFFRYYPELTVDPAAESDDWLISPAVHLHPGKYYVVEYDLRLLGELFPANTRLAMGETPVPENLTRTLLANDNETNDIEWITHSVPFTVDKELDYHFGYQTKNKVPVQFYRFRVIEVPEIDLAVSGMKGEAMASVGKQTDFEVTIHNPGFHEASGYAVKLVDENGQTLAEDTFTDVIPSRGSATVTIGFTPESEGTVTLAPTVLIEGDENSANDKGETMKVTAIDATGTVTIAIEPMSSTPSAPIYPMYNHSAVQTIYTSDLFTLEKGASIKGLTYYISNIMGGGNSDYNADLKLGIGETGIVDFENEEMIEESVFTSVYDDKLTVSPQTKTMTVVFEKPVIYNGGNLCIFTRHSSESSSPLMFEGTRPSPDSPYHSCLYTDTSNPFDYTRSVRGSKELPKVTLIIDDSTVGIDTPTEDSRPAFRYDRASGSLLAGLDCTICNVYTTAGTLIGFCHGGSEISLKDAKGMVIVETIGTEGKKAWKIIL